MITPQIIHFPKINISSTHLSLIQSRSTIIFLFQEIVFKLDEPGKPDSCYFIKCGAHALHIEYMEQRWPRRNPSKWH